MQSTEWTSHETLRKTLTKVVDVDVHYGTVIKIIRGQRRLQGICQEERKNFPRFLEISLSRLSLMCI